MHRESTLREQEGLRPLRALGRACDRAWVEVDHGALRHNVGRLREFLPACVGLMAVVKADAYGHGAAQVARVAVEHGAASIGVATVEEGLELRKARIRAPILVLGPVFGEEAVKALVDARLTPTVCSAEHGHDLSAALVRLADCGGVARTSLPLPVHAKLDTGMSRLGTLWNEASAFLTALDRTPALKGVGLYSHLANADRPDPASMIEQRERFEAVLATLRKTGNLPPLVHLANSAAALVDSRFHYDLVRVGLAIYGILPAGHLRGLIDVRPALAVRARVTQVKNVPQGAGVSYGSAFVARRPMRVAAVGIGYADGVPWRLSGRMVVLLHGRRVRQLGRITMDQIIIDVSDVPGAAPGDIVTLLGEEGCESIGFEEWAAALETIPWEVPCLFKQRLPRVAVDRNAGAVGEEEGEEAVTRSRRKGEEARKAVRR